MAVPFVAIGQALFGFLKPLFGPIAAFIYGITQKRAGKKEAKAEANEHFMEVTDRVGAAVDKSRAERMPGDEADDPNRRD